MRVVDDKVLSEFRRAGKCELCGRRVYPLDPHHTTIRTGIGGGRRLDIDCNLAALCRICHGQVHEFTAVADQVRQIVAKRVGTTTEAIYEWLWLVLRTDKAGPLPERPWAKETPCKR